MILRIEFIESKSPSLKRVLGICRKIKTFKERKEDGMTIYSLDFKWTDIYTAEAVVDFVDAWKGTAYYVDGKLISRSRAWWLIIEAAREAARRFNRASPPESPDEPAPDRPGGAPQGRIDFHVDPKEWPPKILRPVKEGPRTHHLYSGKILPAELA